MILAILILVACGTPPPPRPDIVLITLDTVRADHLGFHGYNRDTTPFLDTVAAESVVFERAIAQAAVTPVSHASLFTGLDPYHHGLRVLHGQVANRLEPSQRTLAERLQEAGYTTAAFIGAYPAGAAFGLDQGFTHFDEDFGTLPGNPDAEVVGKDGTVNTGASQRSAQDTVDAALAWLNNREDDAPLFLWLHFFDPHDLFLLPPRHLVDLFPPAFEAREEVLVSIYDAEIRHIDDQLQRFATTWPGWNDALLALTADHGEGLGQHGWWSHGILYQEQIRVPLVLRVPGIEPSRVSQTVRAVDLVPTLTDWLDLSSEDTPLDGESLRPALETGSLSAHRTAYADSVNILSYGRQDDPRRQDHKDDKLYALIQGDRKFIYHQLQPQDSELYDLAADPNERRNLAAEHPEEVAELLNELRRRGALSDIMPGDTEDTERDRRLESLGYVQ